MTRENEQRAETAPDDPYGARSPGRDQLTGEGSR